MNNLILFILFFAKIVVGKPLVCDDDIGLYSDCKFKNRGSWMSKLDSNDRISSVSMPGTHDSMAIDFLRTRNDNPLFDLAHEWYAETQEMGLMLQLKAGIRAFDVRVGWDDEFDRLALVHGESITGYNFDSHVLNDCRHFLTDNPKEFILMRLKIDENMSGQQEEDWLKDILSKPLFEPFLWINPGETGYKNDPKISSVRGKIVILRDNPSIPSKYGMSYDESIMTIADDYDIGEVGINGKKTSVQNNIQKASMNSLGSEGWFITYASATQPPWWTPEDVAEELNPFTMDKVKNLPNKKVGVIMFDFPGDDLFEEIIFKHNKFVSD